MYTPEAADPFFRVRSELRKVHPSSRLRYSNQFAKDVRSQSRAQSCPEGLRVDEIGEFKVELVRRHNPHARRVCHIKGLNDVPVCVVRDELNAEWENRFIVSPGSLAPTYPRHRKNSSNVLARSNPDYIPPDLSERISRASSRASGGERASRASSRISVPKMSLVPPDHTENDLSDELDSIQALDILCGILQTNSLQTVQAWIDQATEEERLVVIRALRNMKDKGALVGPAGQNLNLLAPLPEDKVSVQYQSNWDQGKSTQNEEVEVKKEEPPMSPKSPAPKPPTSPVATQTPVTVLKKSRGTERPPTRIQMTGLSRPSTMKSVREKFSQMSGSQGSNNAAKDPGFSWTVKHKNSTAPDVASKA